MRILISKFKNAQQSRLTHYLIYLNLNYFYPHKHAWKSQDLDTTTATRLTSPPTRLKNLQDKAPTDHSRQWFVSSLIRQEKLLHETPRISKAQKTIQ